MNLSEREQRFLAELYEAFPDAREVTEGAGAVFGDIAGASGSAASPPALSVTSQVSLFGQGGLNEDA